MPDDHSKLVPLLPIPNRTVKRLSADDSADSRVKVGHCQALTARSAQLIQSTGRFLLGETKRRKTAWSRTRVSFFNKRELCWTFN